MPIVGMSDIHAIPSLVVLGVLRKGQSKASTSGMPKDLDYFRFDTTDAALAERFREVYGPKPRAIHCFLPYDDYRQPDGTIHPALYRIFDTWMTEFNGGKLQIKCDRQQIVLKRQGEFLMPCDEPCRQAGPGPCPKCKETGKLYLIVREFLPTEDFPQGRLGVVQVNTGSIYDISRLTQQLVELSSRQDGKMAGTPVILSRRKESIANPKSAQRQNRFLLHLELDSGVATNTGLLLPSVADLRLLPPVAGDDEFPPDDEEVDTALPEPVPPASNGVEFVRQIFAPPAGLPALPGSAKKVEQKEVKAEAPAAATEPTEAERRNEFFDYIGEAYGIERSEATSYIALAGYNINDHFTDEAAESYEQVIKATYIGSLAVLNSLTQSEEKPKGYFWKESEAGMKRHFTNTLNKIGFPKEKHPQVGDVEGWDTVRVAVMDYIMAKSGETKGDEQPNLPNLPPLPAGKKRTGYEEF